jgi:hypothetical protein
MPRTIKQSPKLRHDPLYVQLDNHQQITKPVRFCHQKILHGSFSSSEDTVSGVYLTSKLYFNYFGRLLSMLVHLEGF